MKQRCIWLAAALVAITASAVADDLRPPPWPRGTPISTTQEWVFNTPNLGPPDGHINGLPGGSSFWNPNGLPLMTDAVGSGWLPTAAGRTGVWSVGPGGVLQFMIPNTPPDPTREKHIWAQITWSLIDPTGTVSLVPFGPPSGTIVNHGTIPLAGGWMHTTIEYILPFNPEREFYQIRNEAPTGTKLLVDQLVLDTICVPEPASFAALGIGLAAVLARRRKR